MVKKVFGRKNVGWKIVGAKIDSKKILGPKIFLLKRMLVKKYCQRKFFLKNIFVEKNFGQKFFLTLKFFANNIFCQQNFCFKNILNFGWKILFLPTKFQNPRIILYSRGRVWVWVEWCGWVGGGMNRNNLVKPSHIEAGFTLQVFDRGGMVSLPWGGGQNGGGNLPKGG